MIRTALNDPTAKPVAISDASATQDGSYATL
jgi:hypothetical protein